MDFRDSVEEAAWRQQVREFIMYVRTAAKTIEAGTSEIERNIVDTRGLGLPRD